MYNSMSSNEHLIKITPLSYALVTKVKSELKNVVPVFFVQN